MTTPRKRYRVDVCRDNAGTLHTLIRRHPGDLPYVWCPHTVRAISTASARQKAALAHQAHEQDFLRGLQTAYPEAERVRWLLQQYGTLRAPGTKAVLMPMGIYLDIVKDMERRANDATPHL